MNPLANYLLCVLKREKTNATRAYQESESALEELGYWCLVRTDGCKRESMPSCKISVECRLVDTFPSYCPPSNGYEGFAVMVDVYEDVKR